MPPRFPLRCKLHGNFQHHVLKNSSRCRLRRKFSSTSAASTSADTSADTNATTTTPYVKDERQTWRVREDGKRKLPVPPILDPIAISQRDRWIEPKKPAAKPADQTPFQKKLYKNAFAHMLSSPVRKDRKLGVSIPSSYLVPLRPLRNPSTDEMWLLPRPNLTPTKAAGSFNAWALARQAHLRALGNTKKGAWRGLTASEQGELLGQGDSQRRGEAVWRADMDDLILRLMRNLLVRQLQYGFSKPRGGGVISRLWEDPHKPYVPYDGSESTLLAMEKEREEAATRRSLTEQLSLHDPPAALLFLRSLTPLSAQPFDQVADQINRCDNLVDRLVNHKNYILNHFHPNFKPGPYSKWAYANVVSPRLIPHVRIGRTRPAVVRWTPQAPEAPKVPEVPEAAEAAQPSSPAADKNRARSHLVPVYSLPDLLGGDDDVVSTLLGGEQGERLWGREAVLLKAGPGAIGAMMALERLRAYVEVPW
ncbi:hypothetical protein IWX50DRAFT_349234 [Phyllosticta citricarpa]|uniref:Uncharacterized protein n=1 Tax=Phyllosticta citricarpa TaxID=55181 RepID=A0ABR1M8R0_9PEZI